jgi:hypothetical protein
MIKNFAEYISSKIHVFDAYSSMSWIDFKYNLYDLEKDQILSKIDSTWKIRFHKGWHAFLFEKNVKAAQQHFYICGRMDEYMVGILGHRTDLKHLRSTLSEVSNVIHWFTALLSGNDALINRRWELKYPEMEDFLHKDLYPVSIQTELLSLFATGNMTAFEQILPLYAKVKKADKYLGDVSYFKALAAGDIPAMEKAIEEVASSKMTAYRQKFDYKDLNKNLDWSAGIFSWDGILYTKFAKMQGYDLKIKSPLVTIAMPLIDAPPLEYYDDEFDFLKVQMPNGIMRTREEIEASGIKIIE